ncbi:MAG: ROK family glucokinase [Lachnospiraceae bacterium]|nr:ROK family glucokinase [Lachnospiraceae bacterium]
MHIGVDVGGTNLVAGVVNKKGEILAKAKCPTGGADGTDAVINDILKLISAACLNAGFDEKEILSIGLGIPGPVDNNKGEVIYCANIPFANVPLAKIIRAKWDVPVHLLNDADAAAYGEAYAGSAKGCSDMMLVTLGTGIGGGIVADGKIYSGFNQIGGEIGHMVIEYEGRKCNCGRNGCWEKYAAASALVTLTKEQMERDKDSALWRIAPEPMQVDGRTAFIAAREGDASGQAVVSLYLNYLACGLSNVINIFQPEIICLGGGVSNEGDNLLLPLQEIVKNLTFRHPTRNTEIRIASLGNDAGIIGAALASQID